MAENQTQTAIRLPDSLLERIDKIAERMSQPGLNPVTRAEVIRLFVMQGADRADAERERRRSR
jgi:predicted DNA-binding protein